MVRQKKPKSQDDIVDDVIRRLVEQLPDMSVDVALRIAKEVRHDWAGEYSRICYIAKITDSMRSQRNDAIVRDYLAGERISFLSRRYNLSERRIKQILKSP